MFGTAHTPRTPGVVLGPVPTFTPCVDCTDLVGAGPAKEPHAGLFILAQDSTGKGDVFRCSVCHCRWANGLLGWARMVD